MNVAEIWTAWSRLAVTEYLSSVSGDPVCLISYDHRISTPVSLYIGNRVYRSHKLICFGVLAIRLEPAGIDRLPNCLLGLWVVQLECHLTCSRNEHDTIANQPLVSSMEAHS